MTVEEDTFTGDMRMITTLIGACDDNDDDAMKGLVVHDRTGEKPQELDLKRGQYVFLTSRVVVTIIDIIIIDSMIPQVNGAWYHGSTGGAAGQGLIAASFVRILPQHVSLS